MDIYCLRIFELCNGQKVLQSAPADGLMLSAS